MRRMDQQEAVSFVLLDDRAKFCFHMTISLLIFTFPLRISIYVCNKDTETLDIRPECFWKDKNRTGPINVSILFTMLTEQEAL